LLYYAFRNRPVIRKFIFIGFSLYFFYKASGYFVALVILSALVDFFLSNAIYRTKKRNKKKLLLILSIMFNLGLLVSFKYTNFFLSIANDLFQAGFNPLNILLPVGISFYTFENLSYTIDVYRGEFEPARNFSDYLLFLSFFPKLVMGPIVRAHDFVPQINQPYQVSNKDFLHGFYLIWSGLFKKLVISDFLTLNLVNYVFDDPSRFTGLENLFALYGYAMVIYCDFSGYSDIAIGIARWLGFSIPTNFLSPYQSKNITEFWRRWHISLSSWLRDYLYIPLGGNRRTGFTSVTFTLLFITGVIYCTHKLFGMSILGASSAGMATIGLLIAPALLLRNWKIWGTNNNLITTMLLGGFWHGASWNFLIWGALHGIYLAIHKVWVILTARIHLGIVLGRFFSILSATLTFHAVCLGWVFFKANGTEAALAMIHQITHNMDFRLWSVFFQNYQNPVYFILLGLVIHAIPDSWPEKFIYKFADKINLMTCILLMMGFLLIYGYFKSAEPVMPIYLQF
jgi:D-alanyl-lipoteichoic acid acyltransferase DltB (MBOAT superfamily)